MAQQPDRQFRILAFVGGTLSLVGVATMLIVTFVVSPESELQHLRTLSILIAIVGLIVSAIALMFAWKSTQALGDNPVAYVAAGIGVALPASLVLMHFVTILQRLVS